MPPSETDDQPAENSPNFPANNATSELDVIVIGGGVSGLRATGLLSAANVNVLLIEASGQLGGRVHTDPDFGDLGATWFHGTVGNSAYDYAQLPQPRAPTDDSTDDVDDDDEDGIYADQNVVLHASGDREIVRKETMKPTLHAYTKAVSTMYSDPIVQPHMSQRDYVLQHMPALNTPFERAVFHARDLFEASILGGSTALHSAGRDGDYIELDGGHIHPSEGMFAALVAPLIAEVPARAVRMNTPVARIRWMEAEGVTVELRKCHTQLRARVVVWTPSANVLRAWDQDGGFVPEIGASKRAALEVTGLRPVAKVVCSLQARVTAAGIDGHTVGVLWNGARAAEQIAPWACGVYSLTYKTSPLRVVFWLTDEPANIFENLQTDTRTIQAGLLLSKVYGELVQVVEARCGVWTTNEFVRGGYSFPTVGALPGRVAELARPLACGEELRVAFAGEATHPRFYSTVHGAFDVGELEARRCLRFLQGEEWRDAADNK